MNADTQTIQCSIDDAARMLGKSHRTIQRKIKKGVLQSVEAEDNKRLVALQVPRVTGREALAALETLRLAITQGDDEAQQARDRATIRELHERIAMLRDMNRKAKKQVTEAYQRIDEQKKKHSEDSNAAQESHKRATDGAFKRIAYLNDSLQSILKNKLELEGWYERGEKAFHKVVSERELLKAECRALRMEIAEYWHDSEQDRAKFIAMRWPEIQPTLTEAEITTRLAELFPRPKRSTPEELAAKLQQIRNGGPRPRKKEEASHA